jgi:hypothetical protein
MTEQQPTIPPPSGRHEQPIPIVRRHWDGNGWTSAAASSAADASARAQIDRAFGRSAS